MSGSKIWNIALTKDGFGVGVSAPTVVDNTVFVGSEKGLYALNCFNGETVWKYNDSIGFGSPVVVDGILYVTSNEQVCAIKIPSPSFSNPALAIRNVTVIFVFSRIVVIAAVYLALYFRNRKTTSPTIN